MINRKYFARTQVKKMAKFERKQQPNIEINTLYEFFKDLNTKGPDEQQSTTFTK
jgi:hypothetical protein